MFNLFASFAEFDREIIRERTKAGLDAARLKGNKPGRPQVSRKKQGRLLSQHLA